MESLRTQLGETQGALTERDKKFRQLRVEHQAAIKSWEQERQNFEARLQKLEAENQRLGSPDHALGKGAPVSSNRATDAGAGAAIGGGVESDKGNGTTVTISRTRMQEIEARYQNVIAQLAEKTKLCEALQQQLNRGNSNSNSNGIPKIILIPPPSTLTTDDQVITHWNLLRERIRSLTLERFNHKVFSKAVSDKAKQEFTQLSAHWKTYLSTPSLTCYLFRALIWRYLHTCFFGAAFGRVWGRDIRNLLGQLSALFSSSSSIPIASPNSKASYIGSNIATDEAGLRAWQMHTATLLERTRPVDAEITNELVTKICDATTPFVTDAPSGGGAIVDTDAEGLRKAIHDIVATSAELSVAFARAPFVVLMSDEPGSTRTQGFEYREATMEMRGKLGAQGTVDMMISPCLLKKEDDYEVLVKAEVVC